MLFKNKSEFKSIFLEFYNPLCNFAHNILKNETIAEDIVQEVFLNLWKIREQLTLKNSLKSYLFKSTKNKVFEHIRSDVSQKKLLEKLEKTEMTSAQDDELSDSYLRLEKINNSLRHLPPKCREVFVMHKFNGLTYSEIADEANISIKTVENHMLKALKILRTHLLK